MYIVVACDFDCKLSSILQSFVSKPYSLVVGPSYYIFYYFFHMLIIEDFLFFIIVIKKVIVFLGSSWSLFYLRIVFGFINFLYVFLNLFHFTNGIFLFFRRKNVQPLMNNSLRKHMMTHLGWQSERKSVNSYFLATMPKYIKKWKNPKNFVGKHYKTRDSGTVLRHFP